MTEHLRAFIGTPSQAMDTEMMLDRFERMPLDTLMAQARNLRQAGHGRTISFSRKVFIPLTRLCRDTCGYCTFATTPSQVASAYLSPDEVLAIARAGEHAGCHEALFTLGDKPELRYAAARDALARLGFGSTVKYLASVCALVLRETTLLPHVNAGIMTADEMALLRTVSVSQGIMLETASDRLCERGGPHFGSPDKMPAVRLAMIDTAGELRIPFTSGILIGIGETRRERIEALLALRALHEKHGHLQEIIVQNFRAKTNTRMRSAEEPSLDDLLWTASVARLLFGPDMNIQVPPNLSFDDFPKLLECGINDWGGVSPVTADHVNPEAPWPDLVKLADATRAAGSHLTPRLAIYPAFACAPTTWLDKSVLRNVLRVSDAEGFARDDAWSPGMSISFPAAHRRTTPLANHVSDLDLLFGRAGRGERLNESDIVRLFAARGDDVEAVCDAADALRRQVNGDTVNYVVTRNINYTNVCTFRCGFCAFSKGKASDAFRGRPYDLALDEVARRAREAWDRGATEVCMQGGIHPDYTGDTYLTLLKTVKAEVPDMHVHAFSPLEVSQGAATLGLPVRRYLEMLRDAGLGSLPGTAAEILDDEIRAQICPDKLTTQEWLDVIETAHQVGLRTTSTVMFGHLEHPRSWALHLLRLRDLQARTGGITEFVPLPFVHMEAPNYARGQTRVGPTSREVRLLHAIARLVLHSLIPNIQVSWVKLGESGAAALLNGGANDLGGTLMNESISRAAGTQHGQEFDPIQMEALIAALGRTPRQRTTLYDDAPAERHAAGLCAAPLREMVQTPYVKRPLRQLTS